MGQALPSSVTRRDIVTHEMAWDRGALPERLRGAVVAIGNFDGLHRGHKAVIARAQDLARRMRRPFAVCTFEPHPANFFAGQPVIFRLTPEVAKGEALAGLGVDGMIVLPFDARMAALPAESFVGTILVERLGITAAVVGYDFHFGRGREGSPQFLEAAGARYGFAVEVIGKIAADPAGDLEAVSSTAIRSALARGDVALASHLLGHDYFVVGEVLHGQKLGRTLGFPTANIRLDPSVRLAHGIYAVTVSGAGLTAAGGVASFGRRPTFDNGAPLLETVVFDYAGDLYGQTLRIDFVAWIRGEEKFDGVDALIGAMTQDAAQARAALALRAGRVP